MSSLLAAALLAVGSPPAAPPRCPEDAGTMAARLLLVGFRGAHLAADATILEDVRRRHLGGVVLYERDVPTNTHGRNVVDPAQLRGLTEQLRAAAGATPLLIAVDQEGGSVRRLGEAFGIGPETAAAGFGERDDARATEAFGRRVAEALSAAGINLNFAPVVDLALAPEGPAIGHHGRSYGADPERVVRHARAFIAGHRAAGVLTVLKHFPGHGSAVADSHEGLPDVSAAWQPLELEPFRRLIAAGAADAVMVAHLLNRQLDPELPATLSALTLARLRHDLGFDGVVIADDLQMKAIRERWDEGEAVERALNAGVDLLLFANNSIYDEAVTARVTAEVARRTAQGRISCATLSQAYRRVSDLARRGTPR